MKNNLLILDKIIKSYEVEGLYSDSLLDYNLNGSIQAFIIELAYSYNGNNLDGIIKDIREDKHYIRVATENKKWYSFSDLIYYINFLRLKDLFKSLINYLIAYVIALNSEKSAYYIINYVNSNIDRYITIEALIYNFK